MSQKKKKTKKEIGTHIGLSGITHHSITYKEDTHSVH